MDLKMVALMILLASGILPRSDARSRGRLYTPVVFGKAGYVLNIEMLKNKALNDANNESADIKTHYEET